MQNELEEETLERVSLSLAQWAKDFELYSEIAAYDQRFFYKRAAEDMRRGVEAIKIAQAILQLGAATS